MTATHTAIESEREARGESVAAGDVPAEAADLASQSGTDDIKRAALVRSLRVVADRIERGETVSEALLAAFEALQAVMAPLESARSARVVAVLRRVGADAKRLAGSTRSLLASGR
jgi:hypothetical protein